MSEEQDNKTTGLQKFSKLNCLWNPEESNNPKVYDSYSYLDLHLNQFLSNIAEDYSFLPNSIYKPSIHVLINNKLVYKTKILDFNNDMFDESIRLKIYSPDTIVTLKLFEHEQFNTTKSDDLDLKATPISETTNIYLVSWVDIEVGLLLPERDYKTVCAFKSNPSFNPYNPGGILYYPTKSNKPAILYKRVCASCKVCSLLSHLAVGTDKNYVTIFKYFDYKFLDTRSESADPNDDLHKKDQEEKFDEEEMDLVEIIDMTSISKKTKKDTCNCLLLKTVPYNFQKKKYEVCLKCHDYEVCCDHTLNNYYLSVNFKLVPSQDKIDFSTELFSCLLSTKKTGPEFRDLGSIFERIYQNYYSMELIFKHLQCSLDRVFYFLKFAVMALVLGSLFNKFLTVFLFLLSVFFFVVRVTSTNQFKKDNGDILYSSRNLPLVGQGFDKFIMKHIEEEQKEEYLMINGKPYTVDRKSIERNNLNISEHHVSDKTKLYTKAHMGYRRCENIAVKTVCFAISESIPAILKTTLLKVLYLSDIFITYTNGILAVVRYYGFHLSVFTFMSGLLSFKFYRLYNFLLKTLLVLVIFASLGKEIEFVKYTLALVKGLVLYMVVRVYRFEWFLNT